jgi:hypothetical protein
MSQARALPRRAPNRSACLRSRVVDTWTQILLGSGLLSDGRTVQRSTHLLERILPDQGGATWGGIASERHDGAPKMEPLLDRNPQYGPARREQKASRIGTGGSPACNPGRSPR